MPRDYYSQSGRDYSDDEGPRSRDKFRRERSPDKDDFGRDKRRRRKSASPEERERRPVRNRSSSREPLDSGDHYTPNYDRDGHKHGPRAYRSEHPPYSSRYGSGHEPYGGSRGGHYDGDYPRSRRRDDGYPDMDGPDSMYKGPDRMMAWGAQSQDDPTKLDYLISFKQYCDHLRNLDRASHRYKRYTDEELQTRYGNYREEFTAKQLGLFFDAHKGEAWFLEKYHPETSQIRSENTLTLRKELYKKFIIELEKGKFDHATCDEAEAKKEAEKQELLSAESVKREDGEANTELDSELGEKDDSGARASSSAGAGSEADNTPMLFLKAVLPNVSRASILERCQKVDGFNTLSLSEPHPLKELQRIGWIKLLEGTDPTEAMKQLTEPITDDFQVVLTPHRTTRARYTHEVANTNARILADAEMIVQIVKACDAELMVAKMDVDGSEHEFDGVALVKARLESLLMPVPSTPELKAVKSEGEDGADQEEEEADETEDVVTLANVANARKTLDLYIEYLRQVHMFCYYCGGDSDNVEEFTRKCSRHFRNAEVTKANTNQSKGLIWIKNLEQKLNLKLRPPSDEELEKMGGKPVEKYVLKFINQKTQQDEPTKWRCKICTKPFRGEEFVHKHIRSKHPDEIKSNEESFVLYNNYVLDPNHINPAAQQQQQQLQLQQQQQLPPHLIGSGPQGYGFAAGLGGFGGPAPPISYMGSTGAGGPMGLPFMSSTTGGMAMSHHHPHFPTGFVPPSFSASAALAGTPHDQIPRIGFDFDRRRGSREGSAGGLSTAAGVSLLRNGTPLSMSGGRTPNGGMASRPPPPGGLQLDPRSRMTDPRKVKSYVDLDAPAEGDVDAKYNLW